MHHQYRMSLLQNLLIIAAFCMNTSSVCTENVDTVCACGGWEGVIICVCMWARMYVLKQVLVNKSVFFRPICLRGLKNTKLGSSFVVYGLPCQCDTKYCQYWHTKINAHWLQLLFLCEEVQHLTSPQLDMQFYWYLILL